MTGALASCEDAGEGTPYPAAAPPAPTAAVPAAPSGTEPSVPVPADGVRRPAGEVAPRSRRPFDPGERPGKPGPADAFEYAVPGIPGTGSHYHVLVRNAGPVEAGLSGNAKAGPLVLRVFRAERPTDAALAAREALGDLAPACEILDPAAAGSCSDAADHAPPEGRPRAAPPVRVVRLRLAAGLIARADAAVAGIPGLARVHEAVLGGPAAGEVWVDVHLVGR